MMCLGALVSALVIAVGIFAAWVVAVLLILTLFTNIDDPDEDE